MISHRGAVSVCVGGVCMTTSCPGTSRNKLHVVYLAGQGALRRMETRTGGEQPCTYLLRGGGVEEERKKEVGCQWESPEEHWKEVGCQSEVAERRDAGLQVDGPTQQLTWRHSGESAPAGGDSYTQLIYNENKRNKIENENQIKL